MTAGQRIVGMRSDQGGKGRHGGGVAGLEPGEDLRRIVRLSPRVRAAIAACAKLTKIPIDRPRRSGCSGGHYSPEWPMARPSRYTAETAERVLHPLRAGPSRARPPAGLFG